MNTTSASNEPPQGVADALGLGRLGDSDNGVDPAILRLLYKHARNEDGKRVLFENNSTFRRGWVNLDSADARAVVSAFVALDDADDLKQARRFAQNNLEAQPWNDVLCIESPPISCRIKIHGSKWAMRFQAGESKLRGRELVNEELPAAAEPSEPSPAADHTDPQPGSSPLVGTGSPINPDVAAPHSTSDASGGLPA